MLLHVYCAYDLLRVLYESHFNMCFSCVSGMEITVKKVIKWLDNYWYHYKWPTVIILFFAVIVIACTVQMAKKTDPDINAVYIGPLVLTDSAVSAMEDILEQKAGDLNGDGKVEVQLTKIVILSDEQLEELKQEAAEENDQVYYDPALRAEAVKQARFYLSGGTTPLCFIDKYMYEIFRDEGILAPLSDIFGEKPENAFDDYGIYLKDTEFGQYYSVFSELPEDTVVCMAVRSFVSSIQNNKQDEQRYNNHVALFRKILEFDV